MDNHPLSIFHYPFTKGGKFYNHPMPRVVLLGVPLDPVTPEEAVACIKRYLAEEKQYHVMTPNSEMLVEASRNPAFRALLNDTSLNIPDSAGLLWMAKLTGQSLPERVTGVDTVSALCRELTEEHPVFLLGAAPGVAELAAEKLKAMNPRLKIAGCLSGSPREEDAQTIIEKIRAVSPHLLLVAYGAPTQDQWIQRHIRDLPSVRVAMGIGGTFDFLAGTRKRAPVFLQKTGLEWMWRLFREPKRIGRIWNAVVIFPLLVVQYGRGNPGKDKK